MSIDGELVADVTAALREATRLRTSIAVVLHGPRGCGKSSLLRDVARAETVVAAAADAVTARNALTSDDAAPAQGDAEPAPAVAPVALAAAAHDWVEVKASTRLYHAPLVLVDNVEVTIAGLVALGSPALLKEAFLHLRDASRAVVVVTCASAAVPSAVKAVWPSPILVSVRALTSGQAERAAAASAVALANASPGAPAPVCRLPRSRATGQLHLGAVVAHATLAHLDAAVARRVAEDGWNAAAGDAAGPAHLRRYQPRMPPETIDTLVVRGACAATMAALDRVVRHHVALHGTATSAAAARATKPLGAVARSLPSSTGVLLHGPHGCGKSLLVTLLAERHREVPFFVVDASHFFSMYLGDSEARLRATFAAARAVQPSVVVLEHVEALAGTRGSLHGSSGGDGGGVDVTKRLLAALLIELDGVGASRGVLIVGTTSQPEAIDAAMMRQGRLESIFHVAPPNDAGDPAHVAAVASYLSEVAVTPRDDADAVLESVAAATAGASLAAVHRLVREIYAAAVADGDGAPQVSREIVAGVVERCGPSLVAPPVSKFQAARRKA